MTFPTPDLEQFVAMLLAHGNPRSQLRLDYIVMHNPWIGTVDRLEAEFIRQERKEVAA